MKARCINLRDHEVKLAQECLKSGGSFDVWRPVKLTGHDGVQADHSQWRFVSTPDSWTGQKDLEKGIYAWQHRTDIKRLIQERCPYGQPGTPLIGREAFCVSHGDDGSIIPYYYADHAEWERDHKARWARWISASQMPAALSRLPLLLAGVEVRQAKTGITKELSVASGARWTDNGTIYVSQKLPGWSHFGETDPDRCHTSWYGSFGAMIERYYPGAWHADSCFWKLTITGRAA